MSHEFFADEIAIDFPSVDRVVDRMRDAFFGECPGDDVENVGDVVVSAEVSLSEYEARRGLIVPLEVPVRRTCTGCGGRGETWTEPCPACRGTGESLCHHAVRLAVPARIPDGARIRFRLKSPDAQSVRVEVRVAVRPAA